MDCASLKAGELISACAESRDPEAWGEFFRRFQPVIAGTVYRAAERWVRPSPSLIDDLVQDTLVKLLDNQCRILREFHEEREDAIYAYIKVITINLVNDYFRAQFAKKRGPKAPQIEITSIQCPVDSTHDGSPVRIERAILMKQIEACLRRCVKGETAVRDILIFELYFWQGFSAKAIAKIPGIGLEVKGVESALFRLAGLIRQELGITPRKLKEKEKQKGFSGKEPLLGGESQ